MVLGAGDNTQMEAFAQRIDQAWQTYRQQRHENFSREARRRTNAFGQRRQQALTDAGV